MTIEMDTLDGLTFASEVIGDGPPVILLHGWGAKIETMQSVAAGLAPKGYAVHTLDLPGFGRSAIPPTSPDAWGAAEYARFVVHYLDSRQLSTVSLIGHSNGGRISIILGADYPKRVSKIVLADGAGVPEKNNTSRQLRKSVFAISKAALKLPGLNALEPRLRDWTKDRFGSEDYKNAGALEPIFRNLIAEDMLPRAARIKAPTLLIWGDQDQETPLWMGQLLEKTIPDAGLVIFQGAGHFAYLERIADFLRIVTNFLESK